MNLTNKIEEVVRFYQNHLEQNYDAQLLKSFNNLLTKDNEEAAASQAIIFNWLRQNELNPKVKEHISEGGADFICTYGENYAFIVEVTCIGQEALYKATGLSSIPRSTSVYKLPTHLIRQKVSGKTPQLSKYNIPTVLAITSFHGQAWMLLGSEEAETYLTSDKVLAIPVSNPLEIENIPSQVRESTLLKESIFFSFSKQNPNEIVFQRQPISAVLLLPISGNNLITTGILHPEPEHSLNINVFPKVPFVRIKNDVIKDREIFTEWVIAEPYSAVFPIYTDTKN